MRAAGVNFVDGLFVQGKYQIKPALPFTPGGEVAGDVVAVGEGVDTVALGDRVLAMPLGGFASHVELAAGGVVPIPARSPTARPPLWCRATARCCSRSPGDCSCRRASGCSCSVPAAASGSRRSTWRATSARG